MCDEPVTVHNYLESDDTQSTLAALSTVGAGIKDLGGGSLQIRGVGLHAALEATGGRLDVGNSGTLLRLLPGWLAGQPGGEWVLDGDESIRRRPGGPRGGATGDDGRGASRLVTAGCPRCASEERSCKGIDYEVNVASAQVKSCVLIAGMLASGATTLTESSQSRDHTERILRRCRVPVRARRPADDRPTGRRAGAGRDHRAGRSVVSRLRGWPRRAWSPGSRVVIEGVGLNWTRTGFLRIVERMGGGDRGGPREAGHRGRRRARRRARRGLRARSRAPTWAATRCRWPSTSSRSWR